MKKWVKRIFLIVLITIVGLFIVGVILFKQAFGPIESTRNVKADGYELLCKQTYNADMAAEFYDVNFTLKSKDGRNLELGNGTFSNEDWFKNIHFYKYANWYILPVFDNNYSKVLLTNRLTGLTKDTILSPLELRYDTLWKTLHNDIPSWVYYGTSKIDTVIANTLIVTYEYRIGDYPPFKFYKQTIEHTIDTTNGNLSTKKIFDRKETKNGS